MHVSATELKNKLGQYLEAAVKEPVIIEKSGRPASVVISYQEFQRFLELEDNLWGLRALKAEEEGFLGVEASERFLKDLGQQLLHEKD
jgi:prevent-host-death family protein